DGPQVVPAIEDRKIKRFSCLCPPQAQGVYGADTVARHRGIKRHSGHRFLRHPPDAKPTLIVDVMLGVSAQLDLNAPLCVMDFPWVAKAQPFVGIFDLRPINDGLLENTVLVPDAIPDGGDFEG